MSLQTLRQKAAVMQSNKMTITKVEGDQVVKDIANGWKKIRVEQTTMEASMIEGNGSTLVPHTRSAFVGVSPSAFDYYGAELAEGVDYNEILDIIGLGKHKIAYRKAWEGFTPNQVNVKYVEDNELIDALITDKETGEQRIYYREGFLTTSDNADVWGENITDPETGHRKFKVFKKQPNGATVSAEVRELAEAGDIA